jgi:hypothetical protein
MGRYLGMWRVRSLYLAPPENALVLCVDEESQIRALDRTAPVPADTAHDPARMTRDYVRNGTTSLFAALDLASGAVIPGRTGGADQDADEILEALAAYFEPINDSGR